jgi:hypothetical protein
VILSNMSDSLFTAPLIEMVVYSYDDYITIMMYLPCSTICLLECSRFRLHLYSYILHMVKIEY